MYYNKKELIAAQIHKEDVVLDVCFLGQGIKKENPDWPHALLKNCAKEVHGLDLELSDEFKNDAHYKEASAEEFSFSVKFDVITALDLIEHLSNPGLFIRRCTAHLKQSGRLILTTPNTFNLFNLAEKLTKREPTTNSDHTFYFNSKTLGKLLQKNGMEVTEVSFLYTLGYEHKESWKKKFLNGVYGFLSLFTNKFMETLVVVAKIRS